MVNGADNVYVVRKAHSSHIEAHRPDSPRPRKSLDNPVFSETSTLADVA
jgi:hypothetical protein